MLLPALREVWDGEDTTTAAMQEFADEHGLQLEVEAQEMPSADGGKTHQSFRFEDDEGLVLTASAATYPSSPMCAWPSGS